MRRYFPSPTSVFPAAIQRYFCATTAIVALLCIACCQSDAGLINVLDDHYRLSVSASIGTRDDPFYQYKEDSFYGSVFNGLSKELSVSISLDGSTPGSMDAMSGSSEANFWTINNEDSYHFQSLVRSWAWYSDPGPYGQMRAYSLFEMYSSFVVEGDGSSIYMYSENADGRTSSRFLLYDNTRNIELIKLVDGRSFDYGRADLESGHRYTLYARDLIDANMRYGFDDWGSFLHMTMYDSKIVSVPEPNTLILLGGGLVGLIGYGMKRLK